MKKLMFVLCAVAASVVSAKTIAFWPFGAKGLTDASGNGNNLEADANVTIGETATMNGAQRLFSTINALNLSGSSAVTVEFWTKFDAADNQGARFFLELSENTNANPGGFYIDFDEAAGAVLGMYRSGGGNSGAEESPVIGLGDGQWHHVAFVMSPSTLNEGCSKLYIDKTHVYTRCYCYTANVNNCGWVAFPSNKKLYIGSRANNTYQFKGEIDNVRVSNVALSPELFVNLDGTVPTVAPIAYWPFGSAGGTDMSGHGNDLCLGASGVTLADGALNFDGAQKDTFTRLPLDLRAYTQGLTMEFWMKAPEGPATTQMVLELSPDLNTYVKGSSGFFCDLNDGSSKIACNLRLEDTYQVDQNATTGVQDGTWHHVAYVIDPSERNANLCRFYLDGVLQTGNLGYWGTNFVALAKEHLYLGSRYGNKFPFLGALDDVRLTPAVLTVDQFMTTRTTEESAVLGHWTFNRGYETVNTRGTATLSATGVTYANGAAVLDGAATLATSALTLEGAATVECFYSTDDTWHHLVRVYGDGIAADPTAVTVDGAAGTSELLVFSAGALQIAGTGFTGRIDDVRVTAGTLAAAQTLAAHTDDTPVELAHWSFDSLAEGVYDRVCGNPLADVSWMKTDSALYERALRIAHSAGVRTARPLHLSQWKALTIEWLGRTTMTNAANYLELGANYNSGVGCFCTSTSFMGDGSPGAGFRTTGGYNIRTTAKGVSTGDGAWHHYAYVLDRSGGSLQTAFYVDGVAQGNYGSLADVADTPFANDHLVVGARYGTSVNYDGYASYVGDIDEIRIVNSALSPAELMTAADRTAQDPVTVAHWRFDGETPLSDRSGNGHDLSGTATIADGVAHFDGSTFLQTAQPLVLSGYRQATVEAVFQTDDPETTAILFETSSDYGSNSGSISCYYNGAGKTYGTVDACTRGLAWRSDTAWLRDTRWHHVAVQIDMDVADRARVRYWIDGVVAGSSAVAFWEKQLEGDRTLGDFPLYLGSRAGNLFFMKGRMKEVRVTSGLLAPDHFLARPAPEADAKNVVAYWPFTRTGDWTMDETGHGYELATTGTGVSQTSKSGCVSFAANHDPLETATRIDFASLEKFTLEAFVRPTAAASMGVIGTCTWRTGVSSHVPGLMFATGTNDVGGVDLQGAVTLDAFGNRENKVVSSYVNATVGTYDAKDGWHHVALVVDRTAGEKGTAAFYYDHRVLANWTLQVKPDFAAVRLAVGSFIGDVASARFVGDIDDVRISAAALAPEQMLQRRSAGLGMMILVR